MEAVLHNITTRGLDHLSAAMKSRSNPLQKRESDPHYICSGMPVPLQLLREGAVMIPRFGGKHSNPLTKVLERPEVIFVHAGDSVKFLPAV